MAEKIEQIIPDFQLLAKVGEGSYGTVYLAKSVTGQYRAVKVVYAHRMGSTEAFEREFRGAQFYEAVSRRHDGLIDILYVGRDDQRGFFYYVMDAADDERPDQSIDPATYRPRTLSTELGRRTALPIQECIAIGLDLAAALVFLQENGLVHRDVKPSNIVFVRGRLKLADIGLVADVRDAKSVVGTKGYEPPEHHGSYAGDVYSLGKLLYEISSGRDRCEFGRAPSEEADTDDPRYARFNEIVRKACAKQVQDRYRSARALLKALTELSAPDSAQAPQPGHASTARVRFWVRSSGIVVIAFIAVVVIVRFSGRSRRAGTIPDAPRHMVRAAASAEVDAEIRDTTGVVAETASEMAELQHDLSGVAQATGPKSDASLGRVEALPQGSHHLVVPDASARESVTPPRGQNMGRGGRAKVEPSAAENEQMMREAHARNALSDVCLRPRMAMCKRLSAAGASLRIAGQKYDELVTLFDKRDWIGLLGVAEGRALTEWPAVPSIDTAVRNMKGMKLNVIVNPRQAIPEDWALYRVTLALSTDEPRMTVESSWEKHPDRVSWIGNWCPAEEYVFVALGPEEWMGEQLLKRRDHFDEAAREHKRLHEIGDLDEGGYRARMDAWRKSAADEFETWAMTELERNLDGLLASQEKESAEQQREDQRLADLLAKEMQRTIGVGDGNAWSAEWSAYWKRLQRRKVTVYNEMSNGELPQDVYLVPGPELPWSLWHRDRCDGIDPYGVSDLQIEFDPEGGHQVTLLGKSPSAQAVQVDGSYETRGNALRLQAIERAGSSSSTRAFYFWIQDETLTLQSFDCRMVFNRMPITVP